MIKTSIHRSLPEWVNKIDTNISCLTPEEQMRFTVSLLEQQIEHMSGGPFAAAIFSPKGKLVAVGVNQVVAWNDPTAHAEMTAFRFGADMLKRFSFNDKSSGDDGYILATTGQMCAMCFGATPWAGVSKVVVGARADDAEKMGFDEGPIHPDWKVELERRGIAVTEGILRELVLEQYARYVEKGGVIYTGKTPNS